MNVKIYPREIVIVLANQLIGIIPHVATNSLFGVIWSSE